MGGRKWGVGEVRVIEKEVGVDFRNYDVDFVFEVVGNLKNENYRFKCFFGNGVEKKIVGGKENKLK